MAILGGMGGGFARHVLGATGSNSRTNLSGLLIGPRMFPPFPECLDLQDVARLNIRSEKVSA